LYKNLNTQTPAPVPAQSPAPPPAPGHLPVSLPPPPAAPSQAPPGSGSLGAWSTSGINMDSFLAGVNFSRSLPVQQALTPQVFPPPFQPYAAQGFVPPPPPHAPRLTLDDIIALVRAGQPSYPGHHHGFPSAHHGYQQSQSYFGPRY
jgi:hypothetical protein